MRIIIVIIIGFCVYLCGLYVITDRIDSWIIVTALYWTLVSSGATMWLDIIKRRKLQNCVNTSKKSTQKDIFVRIIASIVVVMIDIAGLCMFIVRKQFDVWTGLFIVLSVALIIYVYVNYINEIWKKRVK